MKKINVKLKLDKEKFKKRLDIKDGYTPQKGVDYFDGTPGINADSSKVTKEVIKALEPMIPKTGTGEEMIIKINADKGLKKIKKEKIEGLEELENMAKTANANSRLGLRAGGDTVYLKDFSSSTDGVTKSFTLPVNPSKIIMITQSDFPNVLFLNNGFTRSGALITLTASNAPSSGSQLGCLYVI